LGTQVACMASMNVNGGRQETVAVNGGLVA
jgi:hypothetical protein